MESEVVILEGQFSLGSRMDEDHHEIISTGGGGRGSDLCRNLTKYKRMLQKVYICDISDPRLNLRHLYSSEVNHKKCEFLALLLTDNQKQCLKYREL